MHSSEKSESMLPLKHQLKLGKWAAFCHLCVIGSVTEEYTIRVLLVLMGFIIIVKSVCAILYTFTQYGLSLDALDTQVPMKSSAGLYGFYYNCEKWKCHFVHFYTILHTIQATSGSLSTLSCHCESDRG